MPRKPTGHPRGRPKGTGYLGEQKRLTVRIPQDLFRRLEDYAERRIYTRGTPQLAFCVREALEQYLDGKRQTENTQDMPATISGQTVNILPVEDTAPPIPENEIRQTIKVQDPPIVKAEPVHPLLPVENTPHAEPISTGGDDDTGAVPGPPIQQAARRSSIRQLIIDLLRAHSDGLTAIEVKVGLKLDKPIGDTLQGMVRQRLLEKTGSGLAVRYTARP